MKLENQVSSLELSKKLKELGVKQESLFYHRSPTPEYADWSIDMCINTHAKENYSAFTVAELGELLPRGYKTMKTENGYLVFAFMGGKDQLADTEADARAKMLIYLLENKLLKV